MAFPRRLSKYKHMLATHDEIAAFVAAFEARTLPKVRWTHHAHLVVALWYLTHYSYEDALVLIRQRIRAYNESVGGVNNETSGYHETLTQLFLRGVASYLASRPNQTLPDSLAFLLQCPLGSKEWPLRFYSRELLSAPAARNHWVGPDLSPLDFQQPNETPNFHSPVEPSLPSPQQ